MENDKQTPIAIVGMSFRFPGDANTTEGFWDILSNAKSTRTKIPRSRFDPDGFYHPNADRPGAIITKEGCFLKDDIALFDAPFFGITASEAEAMDPQHRLLLEVTYEAFENAGIPITKVAGSDAGCYVGGFSSDYLLLNGHEIHEQSMYQATGCGNSMLSNRLSWFYDLRGPSFTIDTACSSSMVALHEACRDIQDGITSVGVVAGSSLMLVPGLWRALSSQRFLSPDGTCHSFDEQANGYGRGEGVGVVIVKPLADAIRDNDVIRAVIRGSGINQDGKTPAITVPSAHAQMDLIRSTYARAGLDMNHTTYFEAHGTGTPVGDPLELRAIGETIGASLGEHNHPILVGSVKSNIGHLEGSSGIAGVIKTVLAMEHGEIPAVAEFKSLNPRIRQDEWRVSIPTELTPWPADGLRRASINSFGYGGSNAHAILDDALHYLQARGLIGNHNTVPTPNRPGTPSSQSSDSAISVTQATPEAELPAPESKLFVFSSPEQDGLARLAETYSTYLDQDSLSRSLKGNTLDEIEKMHNLAYTLASRRTIFNWRSFAVADSLTGLQTSLQESGLPKHGRSGKKPSCAFVFTGQGAQWYAMGRELLRHAVFRTSIAQADAYLASSLDCAWSLTEELCRDAAASRVNEPQISQPLCTALQVALVDLLRHWCLHPKAVVGHSSGEIGAAYAAGVLSREDAWRVAYWRGVRSAEINALVPDRKGAMMAATLPEEQARQYLGRVKKGGEVVVACINSPNSVTISGDDSAVAEVEKLLAADNIWCRKLLVKTAYHSPHMQLIADQYRRDIQDIRPVVEGQFDIAVFSSVSGSQINPEKMGTADYWVKNLVNPVRFSAAVSSLLKPQDARSRRKGVANVEALVEIGPHSALQGPLRDILAAANESYVGSVPYTTMLQRGVNALQTAITAAGRLWSAGFELDLDLVNSMEREALHSRPLVTLPRYPFNHKRRYWREPRAVRWAQGHSTPRTDLLGQKTLDYSSLMPTWKNLLCPSEIPWLLDHKVHGLLVMPGAVSIAMVMEACRDTADPTRTLEAYEFRDIIWHKPIIFESPDAQIQISLQLSPYKIGTKTATTSTWTRFSITTIGANQEAMEHCSGFVERKYVTRPGEVEKGIEAAAEWERYKAEYEAIKARPTISLTARTMYDKLETHGIQFGPVFRNLSNMQSGEGFMQGEIKTPDTAATMPEGVESALPLHPTVLDASFQMLAATARGRSLDFPMLPSSIESLYVSATAPTAAGTVLKGYCTRVPESAVKASGCSVLWTESGDRPVLVLKGLIVAAAPGPQSATNKAYARLDWVVDVNHSQLPAQLGVRYEKEYAATARLADKVAAKFMREALALVGAPEAIKVENLPVELRNYIAWMRSLSDSVAALDGIGHGQSTEPAPDADVLSSIVKIGTQINSILMSHETKHTVISKTLLADFINRSLGRSVVDSTVVEILDQAGNINPNLEILELASGSNTTVATEVLKRLSGKYSRVAKYIWTGRDGEAVEAARNNLSKPGECIDFKTLEVEGDIQAQGFIPGKFDYIILDDLLLTTSDLDAALKNIKKLLKPDGKLIIQAITKAQPRTAFVLGLAPPWWREGASGERLDEARWDELLRANGFTGVNQAFADSDDPAVHQLSVMLSSATRETAFEYTDVLLVTPATPSPKVARLAENCAARLAGLGLGLSPATLPWTELTDEYVSGKTVVVSLIELDGDVFFDLAPALFHVTKAMALRAGGVLWLTQAGHVSGTAPPGHSVSMGLFRAVRSEYEAKPLASLDLSARVDLASAGAADLVTRLFTTLFAQGDIHAPDKEFAEDNGVVYVQRVVEDIGLAAARATTGVMPQPVTDRLFQEGRKLVMTVGQIGVLDSLQFEDNYECAGPLPQDKVEVKVLYTGLNFVDIMASLGEVPRSGLGSDVVGIVIDVGSSVTHVKPGDTVVGLCAGGIGSHARLKSTACHHVPHNISIQEAATIPLAFTTAWIGLVELAKMRKGETILIHSAAGGVGQAAVQICQHFGVEVFTTVGSVPKKELLMRRYGVPEDHIFYSRDTTFAQGVRRMTHGRGVDLVLNSVAGEFLRQSWHLVAPFGRFVEIGKRNILGNTGLDMEPFIRNVSFIGVNLKEYTEERPEFGALEGAQKRIFELVAAGKLRPLAPINIYDYSDGPKAFRALQSGETVGKIIMRANPDEMVPVVPRDEHPLSLDPNATYLLAGGLGGIGRSIATMLHAHGARNLAFVSRSGDGKDAAKAFLKQLRGLGCTANAYACDIADREQLSRAIKQCQSEMPPIRGSIQCAMMLKDGIFETMTYDDWFSCTRPKIQGSWNLHSVLPNDLDFFIMLASTSGVIGTPGQANYAAGNTFQDALANYRRRQGQKAVALDIGAVRDVGYLAEATDQRYWSMSHLVALSVSEADIHFLTKHAITGYTVGGQAMGGQIIAGLAGAKIGEDRSPWVRDGKLCLALKDSLTKRTADMHAGLDALAKADTAAAAAAIVEEIMIRRVAVAVMIPEDDITVSEPVQTYGVNSLVAVEIKTWLAKEFQTEGISVGEISPSSISTLAKRIVVTSKLLHAKFKEKSEEAPTARIRVVAV